MSVNIDNEGVWGQASKREKEECLMSSERDVVIVDGVRTPFAKAGAD